MFSERFRLVDEVLDVKVREYSKNRGVQSLFHLRLFCLWNSFVGPEHACGRVETLVQAHTCESLPGGVFQPRAIEVGAARGTCRLTC